MKVLIWDWHGSAKAKLDELGLEHDEVVETTQEQVFALSERFTVMLRQPKAIMSKKGKVITPKPDYDMFVAVTTHPTFNQR